MFNPFEHNEIENEKFVPFFEQRQAEYIETSKGEIEIPDALVNFRNEAIPVEPSMDIVDGYKAESQL